MLFSLEFSESELKSLEFNYAKIRIDHDQVKVVQLISNELRELINISSMAMKSIVSSALKEWQMRNNQLIIELQIKPIKERLIAFKEIFNFGKNALKGILKNPTYQNELTLDIAFEKAFKMFLEHLIRKNQRRSNLEFN